MEGTWGRRVFGNIRRTRNNTFIYLEITMGRGHISANRVVLNRSLDNSKGLYKRILDEMTRELEAKLESLTTTA